MLDLSRAFCGLLTDPHFPLIWLTQLADNRENLFDQGA
jgi:hypothetical protein